MTRPSTSSTLSTDQLIQLCHEVGVMKPAEIRHVDWLMKAHLTGSTPHFNREELISYFESTHGSDPDTYVYNRDFKAAEQSRSQPEGRTTVRIIDLSKQAQPAEVDPATLVAHPCDGGCGIRLALPLSDVRSNAPTRWCPACLKRSQATQKSDEAAARSFLEQVPESYNHAMNWEILGAAMEHHNITNVTADDLI